MTVIDETTPEVFQQDSKNANRGTKQGMAALKTSVAERGIGRSIVVDKEGRIIAGNKAQLAALDAGIKEAIVVHTTGKQLIVHQRDDLEINSPEARLLAIEDNRIGQMNLNWDMADLKEKLGDGIPLGKLWSKHELEAMFDGIDLNPDDPKGLDDVSGELPGAASLKEWMDFPSTNKFGFPDLLDDMLADMPENIEVWAGHDASNLSHDGWWLYNYGTDSMRGLDTTKAILSFYTDDYRFDSWYVQPAKYVGKLLNSGFKIAVSPNYSLYKEDPIALHIFAVFKSRYVARYLQEAGVRIIPDVDWGCMEDLEFCLMGIPKRAPCIMMQLHAASVKDGCEDIAFVLETLEPQKVVIYGGSKEKKIKIASCFPDVLPVVWQESRALVRAKHLRKRR